jgi:protein ImuB
MSTVASVLIRTPFPSGRWNMTVRSLVVQCQDCDARDFEPVLVALEGITPRVEITEPGVCMFPTIGPSRYFGGDKHLARKVSAVVAEAFEGQHRVGIADGPFAAILAASGAAPDAPQVVPEGRSRAFLAPYPVTVLTLPELGDVLIRLGIDTLGKLADLPLADMVGRFGNEGRSAHELASGLDGRPLQLAGPTPDLEVFIELEPPVERVDQAAFVAKALADELCSKLSGLGTTCYRILIGAETEHGEELQRIWRGEEAMNSSAIADRVRWQLDGWLNASPGARPTGGLVRLGLSPDQVGPAVGRQLGFWGGQTAAAERAARAVARIQGILGEGSVVVPELQGGRAPEEQVGLVPAEAVDLLERNVDGFEFASEGEKRPPWPGSLPPPAPAEVSQRPIELLDADGSPVGVSGRGVPSASPCWLRSNGNSLEVEAWAGPWPVDERWWDPQRRSRRARFQVVTAGGAAHLLALEDGSWRIEATYD